MKKYLLTLFAILAVVSLVQATSIDSNQDRVTMKASEIYSVQTDENWIEMFNEENGGICFTSSDIRLLCITTDLIEFHDSVRLPYGSAFWVGNNEGITTTEKILNSEGKPCTRQIEGGIVVSSTC